MTTPAPTAQDYLDGSHQRTIWFVVRALSILAFALYVLVGIVIILDGKNAVPGELWQAAAGATGLVGGILMNPRTESGQQAVVQQATFLPSSVQVNTDETVDAVPDVSPEELADDTLPAGPTDAPDQEG